MDGSQELLKYRARLLAYLMHLVGDPHDAEDLLQELTVIVLESPTILTRAGDVFAYLRGVARHLAASRHRHNTKQQQILQRWTEWAWENDLDDARDQEDRGRLLSALRRCLEKLPTQLAQIVRSRYHEGRRLSSISDRLGMTHPAIKSALFRARRDLAKCIRLSMTEEGAR